MDSIMRKQPRCNATQILPSSDKVTLQYVIHRSVLQFNNQAVCVFIPDRPATLGSSKIVWAWLRVQRRSQHAKALCSDSIALHD